MHTFNPSNAMDRDALDAQLARLGDHAETWARVDIEHRLELLDGFIERTLSVAEDQVAEACRHKGLERGTAEEAEEWLGGPIPTIRTARAVRETLEDLRRGSAPVSTKMTRRRDEDSLAVDVFPQGLTDHLVYAGFSAEVWLDSDVDRSNLSDHVASFYRQDDPPERVGVVLGAGNIASIPPLDLLKKLFIDGSTAILKLNPVNEYLHPFFEERFADFIEAGYVEITEGGAEVGDYLCTHERVDSVHVTGSIETHDAIVFGTDEEAEERKDQNRPRLQKPVTSELGNVSPVIVVPGPWTEQEIEYHAENLASQLANNAGFNCDALQVLVTPEDWSGRSQLIAKLRSVLEDLGPRTAYYPGADRAFERFSTLEEDAIVVGDPAEEELPYALLPDVDPNDEEHPIFREEAWCAVAAETRLPGDDPGEFLRNAVDFCNEILWGTLNASIIVHPETERDLGVVLDEAIENLVYGSIVLNHWPAVAYGLGLTPWGGYPGFPLNNVQSGRGFVHNGLMLESVEKTVVRGPFTTPITPPWFATDDSSLEIAPSLAAFEANPSAKNLLGVVWRALT